MRFINEVAVPYEGADCLTWPFGTNEFGYAQVKISKKTVKAYRYVCEIVHGQPPTPKHDAAHSCGKGNMGCVNPNHLSWKTRKENMADKVVHGTHNRGERHPRAKLTRDQALEILRLKGTKTQTAIAADFGVNQSAVRLIHIGKNWAWLQQETKEPRP